MSHEPLLGYVVRDGSSWPRTHNCTNSIQAVTSNSGQTYSTSPAFHQEMTTRPTSVRFFELSAKNLTDLNVQYVLNPFDSIRFVIRHADFVSGASFDADTTCNASSAASTHACSKKRREGQHWYRTSRAPPGPAQNRKPPELAIALPPSPHSREMRKGGEREGGTDGWAEGETERHGAQGRRSRGGGGGTEGPHGRLPRAQLRHCGAGVGFAARGRAVRAAAASARGRYVQCAAVHSEESVRIICGCIICNAFTHDG